MKNIDFKEQSLENIDKLVSENEGLVWSIIKRFKNRGYELEELYQIGVIGLIKAIKRFDISFNTKLSTYAVPYIIGEIKIFLRDDGIVKVSRNLKELNSKIKLLEKEYEEKNKSLTINMMKKILKTTTEDILLAKNLDMKIDSINEYTTNDENQKREETLLTEKNRNQEANIIEKIMLKDALKNLEEKEKSLIILRYFKECTQEEVAKMYGVSQVQISRREKKILQKMRNLIKEI